QYVQNEVINENVIGKKIKAKNTIHQKVDYTKEVLNNMKHLHQLLIVSDVILNEKHPDAKAYKYVDVHVEKHDGEKCDRCWVFSDSVGENSAHPTLCTRCANVVEEHYSHLVD